MVQGPAGQGTSGGDHPGATLALIAGAALAVASGLMLASAGDVLFAALRYAVPGAVAF
jgi:hypothetical protein